MKSSKSFNNISPELLAKIPKLKPNEAVTFQMLNGSPNNDPDLAERQKDPVLYGKVQVLTQFRIYDEAAKGYVDIGCVDAWDGDKPVRFRTFVPGAGHYSRFQGKFELRGGNVRDEELFEILWLSPERQGSPCADSSVEIMFKILDQKAETTASVTKFDRLKKTIEIVDTITPAKAREVFAALNQPSYTDDEVVLAKIKDFAKSNVDTFLNTYESPDTEIKATVKNAFDAGVISHDPATGEVRLGKTVLTNLKVDNLENFTGVFTDWVKTAENGKDVLANLKKQLSKNTEATV